MKQWPSILDFKLDQDLVSKAAVQGFGYGIECARSAIKNQRWDDWSSWGGYSGWLPSKNSGREQYEAILEEAAAVAYELVRKGWQASLDAKAEERKG